MTSLNAHNLGRILDQVRHHQPHSNLTPVIDGIRLDADHQHIYAAATDRYTFAVARAKLLRAADKHREAWAHTVPSDSVGPLRKWVQSLDPNTVVTISPSTEGDIADITFTADSGSLTFQAQTAGFPQWRSFFTGVLGKDEQGPVVGMDTTYAARWQHADRQLRTWKTGATGPIVFAGRDFIGLQMPTRVEGEEFSREAVAGEWAASLGDAVAADTTELAVSDKDAKQTRDFAEFLLRKVIVCTDDVMNADVVSSPAFYRTIDTSVSAWSAYRLLEALRKADPTLAETTLRDLDEELEGGEYSEWAWEYAQNLGHDPEKWTTAHREWRAGLDARNAAEQPDATAS